MKGFLTLVATLIIGVLAGLAVIAICRQPSSPVQSTTTNTVESVEATVNLLAAKDSCGVKVFELKYKGHTYLFNNQGGIIEVKE